MDCSMFTATYHMTRHYFEHREICTTINQQYYRKYETAAMVITSAQIKYSCLFFKPMNSYHKVLTV